MRVRFLLPDDDRPSGGIRKAYRHIDLLASAGVDAAIVHTAADFRCTWFEHTTPIVTTAELDLTPGDLFVVPEIYGPGIGDLLPGVPKLVYNQNVFNTFGGYPLDLGSQAAAYRHPEVVGAVVVSDDNVEHLSYAFPELTVERVRYSLDPELYHAPTTPPRRRIAFMPRKRADEVSHVLQLLRFRGALDGWEVVAIDGMSEAAAADALRSSAVFLSLSQREGFGLPPAEAIACGCAVVGFHGFGGREFFDLPTATAVEDGDLLAFARAAEEVLASWEPGAAYRAGRQASAEILGRYPVEREREDVVAIFGRVEARLRSRQVAAV